MEKGLSALVRKLHINYTLICQTALPYNISLFLQTVHVGGQGADCDRQLTGYHGHILELVHADRFYNVHVIVADIAEFRCDDSLRLHIHHMIEQIHQQFIYGTFCALCHLPLLPFPLIQPT